MQTSFTCIIKVEKERNMIEDNTFSSKIVKMKWTWITKLQMMAFSDLFKYLFKRLLLCCNYINTQDSSDGSQANRFSRQLIITKRISTKST